MPDFNPEKTPGAFEAPPAHAPHEVTQPISDSALAEALAKARANERELPPFNPQPTGETRMGVAPPTTLHAPPREAPRSHQPAASNTDSPSRGIPKPIADPGKQITGGWGPQGAAQYYPLSGAEMRELVRELMDRLNKRIEDDLRFSIAITYPRVKCRLVLEVEAHGGSGFEIEYIKAHDKTPLSVARQNADLITFVLMEQRQEFNAEGQAEDPPDRLRDELGLPKPMKQQVQTPGGKQFVDRPSNADQAFF